MSVQAGLWYFDGRPVERQRLLDVSASLAQHGPDGEHTRIDGSRGFLYRPFHTTAESRLERQPLVTPAGHVLTWDGRLDNREEIRAALDPSDARAARATDAALVMAAYERWGEAAIARLAGDFALVLWDAHQQALYLAQDFIGARKLYFTVTRNAVLWCSGIEPLLLAMGRPVTVDDRWLGTYLMFRPDAYRTPFNEIQTVGPAGLVRIDPRQVRTRRHWNWPARPIRCRDEREYEEEFRRLFRAAVSRRLRADTPVLCELSGGLDSTAIVCAADALHAAGAAETPRIDTISHCYSHSDTDPHAPWIAKAERHRGRAGAHWMPEGRPPLGRPADLFHALPGGLFAQLDLETFRDVLMREQGNRVILSGLGGDEVLGGIPYPFGQLGDQLVSGKVRRFWTLLRAWSRAKRMPLWRLAALTVSEGFLKRSGARASAVAWVMPEFARRARLHSAHRASPAGRVSWWRPGLRAFAEGFESERQVLTVRSLPLVGVSEVRFPYMDRTLVEFLAAIPSTQLLRPGDRRSLMRRALRGLVPDELLDRIDKAAGREPLGDILAEGRAVLEGAADAWPVTREFFDTPALHAALRAALHGVERDPLRLLRGLAAISWLSDLDARGIVSSTTRSTERGSKERAHKKGGENHDIRQTRDARAGTRALEHP